MKWDWFEATLFVLALGVVITGIGWSVRPRGGRRGPVDWRGMAIFVLALGVATAIVAGFLTAELTRGPITSEEVGLISTLGGAAIGAVATYVGITNGGNTMETERPERDEPVEPEPVPAPEVDEPPTDDDGNPVDEDELTQGMGPGDDEGGE